MAAVSTYLNFEGTTEAAFEFYKSVFETDYIGEISRFGDAPPMEGVPPLPDHARNLILNVQLPILGGHVLLGTDALDEFGQKLVMGTNVSILLRPDSREDADSLFSALSDGGSIEMPMADQFWGDYYGSFTDKFGVQWMIAHSPR